MADAERTLFYGLPLLGVGTPEVESARSYIQRLALAHNFRPRTLLEILMASLPQVGLFDGQDFMKRWDVHGFSSVGRALVARLERATGSDLSSASLDRLRELFGTTYLTRFAPHHCPICVREGEGITHGRLAWEVECVKACPRHGVSLVSSKVCGAEEGQRLPVSKRPMLSSVCSGCGSLGFRCQVHAQPAAPAADTWVAGQIGELLALPSQRVAALNLETLRAGLRELVKARYGGSVVRASREAGLARASVCTWAGGKGRPSLAMLAQLCHHGEAGLVALLEGRYECAPARGGSGEHFRTEARPYQRASMPWSEVRAAILKATTEVPPPSLAALAKRIGVSKRVMRSKLPQETSELVVRNTAHRRACDRQRYAESVAAYTACAQHLMSQGIKVSSKHLQKHSGLSAFSQNKAKARALAEVVGRYTGG